MKNILIFSHAMEIGGAERALLGLLEAIDTERVCVDLFLMRHTGVLLKYIPKGIKLLPEVPQYACLAVPISQVIAKGHLGVAAGRCYGKYKAAVRVKKLGLNSENDVALEYSHKYTLPFMPNVSDKEYDLAISFLTPHYFAARKVQAKQKIAWIHTDYAMVDVDQESQLVMWDVHDRIISISDAVSQSFLKVFPQLSSKIELIENIQPKALIQKQTMEFSVEDEMSADGSIRLLSIGRFSTPKNFDNVPDICRRILGAGLNVKWYLIGYGGDEALIRQRIADAGMENHVIILGKKENPYPYIKACDLYVQPSRYEGKSVSVREAQMLCKPVVITRYATSASQLEEGVDGIIVPMDNEGCAQGIAELLKNSKRMEQLSSACSHRDYTNAGEVKKVYRMLGMD